LDEYQESNSRG
jgi:hypothetical protein